MENFTYKELVENVYDLYENHIIQNKNYSVGEVVSATIDDLVYFDNNHSVENLIVVTFALKVYIENSPAVFAGTVNLFKKYLADIDPKNIDSELSEGEAADLRNTIKFVQEALFKVKIEEDQYKC